MSLAWDGFTVHALRQLLLQHAFDQKFLAKLRKAELIEVCREHLSSKDFHLGVKQFGNKLASQEPTLSGKEQPPIQFQQKQLRSQTPEPSTSGPPYETRAHSQTRLTQVPKPATPHETPKKYKTPSQSGIEKSRSLTPSSTPASAARYSAYPPHTVNSHLSSRRRDSSLNLGNSAQTERNATPAPGGRRISFVVDDNDNTPTQKRVVVSAGRFSVPTEDVVLSPTRVHKSFAKSSSHSRARYSGISPAFDTKKPSTSVSDRPQPDVVSSIGAFPSVDPTGDAVRWRVRDPTAQRRHSLGKDSSQDPRQQSAHGKGDGTVSAVNKSPKKSKRLRKSAIVLVLIFIWMLLACFWPETFGKLGRSNPTVQSLIWRVQDMLLLTPYCTEEMVQDNVHCFPCPSNAFCRGTYIRCVDPLYKLEAVSYNTWWNRRCIRNHEQYSQAYTMVDKIGQLLAKLNGELECLQGNALLAFPYATVPGTPQSRGYVSLTEKEITEELVSRGYISSLTLESLSSLIFQKILIKDKLEQKSFQYTIKIIENTAETDAPHLRYYTTAYKYPLGCRLRTFYARYWFRCVSLLLFGVVAISRLFSWKREASLKEILRDIIAGQTRIEHLPNGRGYASGPTVHDIYLYLKSGKSKKYKKGSLTPEAMEAHIEHICDELRREDPNVKVTVTALNQATSYYDQAVIDQLSAHSNTTLVSSHFQSKLAI